MEEEILKKLNEDFDKETMAGLIEVMVCNEIEIQIKEKAKTIIEQIKNENKDLMSQAMYMDKHKFLKEKEWLMHEYDIVRTLIYKIEDHFNL